MTRMALRGAAVAALALTTAPLLAACGSDSTGGSTVKGAARLEFELTDSGCSPSSATVPAGPVTIVATNNGTAKTDEIELKDRDGTIIGERENLAPGISNDFTLTLQPGRYTLNCSFQNEQRDNGTIVVTGRAVPTQSASSDELDHAVEEYKEYVQRESDELVAQTQAFAAALKAGQLERAKNRFAAARIHYEAIEPIAEAFGDLDPQIDARVNDVPDRSKWTGFHRIEQILWQQGTTRGTARYADLLVADVKRLDASIPGLDLQAAQIANGAVELLDEVSASKITGEEDRYSHTDLADFQGNLSGSKQAFETLAPALAAIGDGELVHEVAEQFAKVQAGLDRYRRDTPLGFAPYSELTRADRRAFAQQIAAVSEPLSQVPGKLAQQG